DRTPGICSDRTVSPFGRIVRLSAASAAMIPPVTRLTRGANVLPYRARRYPAGDHRDRRHLLDEDVHRRPRSVPAPASPRAAATAPSSTSATGLARRDR